MVGIRRECSDYMASRNNSFCGWYKNSKKDREEKKRQKLLRQSIYLPKI